MADQNPAGPQYPSSAPLPSAAEQAPYEMGYPLPPADKADLLPPGDGHLAFPHFLSFASVVNLATRTYRYTFDEAIKDSFTNSLAIRRDPIVYEAMRSRQVPVAQLPWHLEASNDQDPRQASAVQVLSDIVDRIPRFQQLTMQLLEAVYYGRYGSQLVYGWDFSTGRKLLVVRDHKPINGDKLVFRYSGQAGVLVHSTFAGPWEVSDRGRVHFFTATERETIVLHRHEPEDADFFEGELAGGIQGVGLRSRIYYLWKLKNQVLAIMMDYLERVGAGGFTVYYYDAGNPKSLAEVTAAAQQQFRNNTILFPRYRNSRGVTGGPGVERVEAGIAGAELLRHLVMDYFDELIRRTVGGSRLTREGSRSLIGSSDLANLDAETEANYVKYDAVNLQETFTSELVSVLQRYNFPELPAGAIRFKYDVDKPNTSEVLEAAERFYNMGGVLDEDDTRSVLGLPAPEPGHTVLSKVGAMQAELAAQAPMMTQPGVGGSPPAGQPPPVASAPDSNSPMQFAAGSTVTDDEKKTGPMVQFSKRGGDYDHLRAVQEIVWLENEYLDRKANQSPEQADRWLEGYMGDRLKLALDVQPGPLRMAKRGTPEAKDADAASAAFKNGQLGVKEYIAAQPPGYQETIDGNVYLSSMDGPQVRRVIPTALVTMRPQSYRNPDLIKAIRKDLRNAKAGTDNQTSTGDPIEPISVTVNPKAAGQWRVFDGHHRLDAYEQEGEQEIPAWTPA